MWNRVIGGGLAARLLGRAPILLIFVVPVIAFFALAFFREPQSSSSSARLGQSPVREAQVSAPKKPSAVSGGLLPPLEPLRSKIIRAKPETKTVSGCVVSNSASGLVTVAEEETPIMLGPSSVAKPLKDWNGAQRFLDPRYDLKILEDSGDWVRVAVVSPDWPPGNVGWTGWIERKGIQKADGPEAKRCLFIDPGAWTGLPSSVQSAAKNVALQILRQDDRCRRISRGGFLGNGQRFYLTCYPNDGAKPYHYWLSASNLRRDFSPPALVDEDNAMLKCRGELQKALSGQAMIEGKEATEAQIENFQARRAGSVYQISIEFRAGGSEMLKAFCLVAPGGGAEITLGDPS
jgi:hypothetical protein